MIPPTIASLISTVVLVWVYAYLSCARPRRKYLALLTLGWSSSLIKTAFELAMAVAAGSTRFPHLTPWLNTGHLVFALLNGFLVVWGTFVFLERRLPRLSLVPWVLVLVWILGSAVAGHRSVPLVPHTLQDWVTSPFALNLAVYELLAGAMIVSGILFLHHSMVPGPEKYTVAVLFVVWGLHRADYPFVLASSSDILHRAGYQVASGLQIATAVAILLLFFKAANLELVRSEQRYRALVDHAPEAIFLQTGGCFAYVNPAALRLYGASRPEQLLGRPVLDLVPLDYHEQVRQRIQRIAQGHVAEPMEQQILRLDGGTVEIEVVATPCEFGGQRGAQVLARDITARKRAEEDLRQSEEHYRQAAETNRRLLQEVNHRVRNNLGALLSLVDLVQPKAADIPDFAAAMRSRIGAMATIHNLLSHAGWRDFDLRGLLGELIHGAEPLAPQRASVELQGPNVILSPPKVVPLAMAVQELMTNSSKYGAHSRNGGRLQVTWTVRPQAGRDILEITWRETGGPPVNRSMAPSLGSQLVEGFVTHEMGGRCQLRYTPDGANHLIEFPLDAGASQTSVSAAGASGGVQT